MPLQDSVSVMRPFVIASGNSVMPGTKPLATVPYADALQALIKSDTLEAYSRDSKNLLAPEVIGSAHGFVGAAQAAYAGHYPLVLSPDMIWLLIAQGFAIHVRQNAEELRHHFVAHQGKVELLVERSDFIRGFAGNDWEKVFTEFSEVIRVHIGAKAHDTIVPTFSTTGIVEKASFEVTLMDAMQSYFNYTVKIICGIPQFLIEGSPKDWKQIRNRAADLQQYDLEWWIPLLLPILDEFVAASEGKANQNFWQDFYQEQAVGCGGPHVTGKILTFFPYSPATDKKAVRYRKRTDYQQREDAQKKLALILDPEEYTKQLHIVGRELDRLPTQAFERNLKYIPSGLSSALSCAPFTLVGRYGNKHKMEFLAGFVGASQDENTLAIRPKIGWAVRETPQ